ncbi:MAG: hypothetical protein CMJ72_09555 [Planctomycetaceae bacterium]|nr:hypothetical protein [Planctomycetaceae bacterium]HCK40344.1 hypothetical protein [Planctomycetaceae bacterium]
MSISKSPSSPVRVFLSSADVYEQQAADFKNVIVWITVVYFISRLFGWVVEESGKDERQKRELLFLPT